MRRTLHAVASMLAVVTATTIAWATPAWASSYSGTLRSAVSSLPVATEVRTGYDRSLFPLWIDADGDGCNTRYEILIAEAVTKPTVGSGCSLSGGKWFSY